MLYCNDISRYFKTSSWNDRLDTFEVWQQQMVVLRFPLSLEWRGNVRSGKRKMEISVGNKVGLDVAFYTTHNVLDLNGSWINCVLFVKYCLISYLAWFIAFYVCRVCFFILYFVVNRKQEIKLFLQNPQ